MSQEGSQSLEHGRITSQFEDVIGRIRTRFRQLGHPGAGRQRVPTSCMPA